MCVVAILLFFDNYRESTWGKHILNKPEVNASQQNPRQTTNFVTFSINETNSWQMRKAYYQKHQQNLLSLHADNVPPIILYIMHHSYSPAFTSQRTRYGFSVDYIDGKNKMNGRSNPKQVLCQNMLTMSTYLYHLFKRKWPTLLTLNVCVRNYCCCCCCFWIT